MVSCLVTVLLTLVYVCTSDQQQSSQRCKCVPPDSCWNQIPWNTLNASVNGRLLVTKDEVASCIDILASAQCTHDLNATDDEFYLTSKAGGFLHTGLFSRWNISDRLSAFTVAAETEQDIQAAVVFANLYNLRLVVKGTGHDWFGRSTAAGALTIWTHHRKRVTFVSDFVASQCGGQGVQAAIMQSGVQFADLYPEAEAKDRMVMGGTCDSVGIGGCTLGGCYGPFSKTFGSAATNLIEARVVLANGSLVTTNRCRHPDLFWAIRGGGAGFGIVTEFTARTYAAPRWVLSSSITVSSTTSTGYHDVFVQALRTLLQGSHTPWNGGLGFETSVDGGGVVSLGHTAYDGCEADAQQSFAPFIAWATTQNSSVIKIEGNISFTNKSAPFPSSRPYPWDEWHPDREISTSHLVSLTKYITRQTLLQGPGDAGLQSVAWGLMNVSSMLHSQGLAELSAVTFNVGFDKASAGQPPAIEAMFNETSQNPVLLQTIAQLEVAERIPWLPQLKPSSKLLKTMWPRLQHYAITKHSDVLYQDCDDGANGDEEKAVKCFSGWLERVPQLQAELEKVKEKMLQTFPNTDDNGVVMSGSYWNEADYDDFEWQQSHWGVNYKRLYGVKQHCDPYGLFVCHHCVGSEDWSDDGNCPK